MKLISYPLIFLLTVFVTKAQFPSNIKEIRSEANQTVEIKGKLSEGIEIKDLSWASKSSTACFPATQNQKFTGLHVLYGTKLPPYSEMTITLIPDDPNANFSLYGYQVGATYYPVVPDLSSCVSCEADHKWDYPKRGKKQDHTRSIFFNAIKNPYNIFIGVTGADRLKSGSYKLKIALKTRVKNTKAQKPLKIYKAASGKGETKAYKGNLKDGVKIHDLSWASNSSVACFPATQNQKFTGNHVVYITELPKRSVMEITLIPSDKNANMSLYAYTTGLNNKALVPNLSSCVSCESDHKWDRPKRGKTQDHTRKVRLNAVNNPYRVVIGVAGANGLTDGEFVIKVKVE